MKNLILTEPVLDGQQVGPVTINIDGASTTASIVDSILNGQGSEIHITVDEGLQIVGLEDLAELAALLADIEARVAEVLLALDAAVDLANQTLAELNAAMADLQALVARAELAAKNAMDSEVAAKASEIASKASEVAAEAAAAAALLSEQAAKASEVAAKASQDAAKLSQEAAKASEIAAALSEQSAISSAAEALASENAAKVSENNAKASEIATDTSEANALASAESASADATKADTAAKAAKASETVATNAATEAQASEAAAEASKIAAATSASAAQTSQEAAALNETNSGLAAVSANDSKNLAKKYANDPEDTVVEPGYYSALHWAEKAKKYAQQVFVSAGTFTPTTTVQYPDTTSVARDTIWMIKLPASSPSFTYTTGDLAGTTVAGGDFLFYDTPANTWEHIPVGLVGILEINGKTGQSVELTAQDVGALPITGGILTGALTARVPITSQLEDGYGMAIGGTTAHSWISPVKLDGTVDNANQISFDPVTGTWSVAGHKMYTAGQAPRFTDLADYVFWLAPNAGKIRVGGTTDLVAGADNKGFLPRKEGVGAAAVSYLGSSTWWFQDAWVNKYNGGSLELTDTAAAGKFSLPGWAISQHATSKNLEFRKNTGNTLLFQIVDSNNSARFAGQLFENNTNRVYSTGNKPTATDVGALPITGGTLTGVLNSKNIQAEGLVAVYTSSSTRGGIQLTGNTAGYGEIAGRAKEHSGFQTAESLRFYSDKTWRIGTNKIYHEGFKPGAADVNALPITGGTLTGPLNIVAPLGGLNVRGTDNVAIVEGAGSDGVRRWYLGKGTAGTETISLYSDVSGRGIDIEEDGVYVSGSGQAGKLFTTGFKPTGVDVGILQDTPVIGQRAGWYKLATVTMPQSVSTVVIELSGGAGYSTGNFAQVGEGKIVLRSGNGTPVGITAVIYNEGGTNPVVSEVAWKAGTNPDEYEIYGNAGDYALGVIIKKYTTSNATVTFETGAVNLGTTKPEGLTDGKTVTSYNTQFVPTPADVGSPSSLDNKAVFIPSGTTATRPEAADFPPNTRALRYNTETLQWEGVDADGNILPIGGGGSGGSGVPPFIERNASFTVVKNQAYALSMVDGVTKTVTVPAGFNNTDWFVLDVTKWDRGLAGLVANIVFEGDVLTNGKADYTSLTIDRPCVAYFQKVGGKWQWVDGVGIDGSYSALETRVDALEIYPTPWRKTAAFGDPDNVGINLDVFSPNYEELMWRYTAKDSIQIKGILRVGTPTASALVGGLSLPNGCVGATEVSAQYSFANNNHAASLSGLAAYLSLVPGENSLRLQGTFNSGAWFMPYAEFKVTTPSGGN